MVSVGGHNQAGTIAGKVSAVLHFHRVSSQTELPSSSPLIKRALKGVARSHVATGTPKELVALFRGTRCLEDRNWPGRGGRIVEFFGCPLDNPFVARSDKILRLAYRSDSPRKILDEGRRTVMRGGGTLALVAVSPGHHH